MMKTILLLLLTIFSMNAQSKLNLMAGYKATEIGYSYVAENELIYGLQIAITDSKESYKHANRNDINKNVHKFYTDVVPAVFGTIGGKFDNFSMSGKLGSAYIQQDINGIPDSQKFYFAVGIIFDYEFRENTSLRASYDNVSGALVGIGIKF